MDLLEKISQDPLNGIIFVLFFALFISIVVNILINREDEQKELLYKGIYDGIYDAIADYRKETHTGNSEYIKTNLPSKSGYYICKYIDEKTNRCATEVLYYDKEYTRFIKPHNSLNIIIPVIEYKENSRGGVES